MRDVCVVLFVLDLNFSFVCLNIGISFEIYNFFSFFFYNTFKEGK